MSWILGAIVFLVLLSSVVALGMRIALKNTGNKYETSRYIVNKFEPDNTAPMMTELINYHKNNEETKYKVEGDNN